MCSDQVMRILKSAARSLFDRAIPDRLFEASWRVHNIRRPSGIEADMPQMTRAAKMPAQQAAIDHQRAADAGTEREHQDVLHSTRRPQPDFSKQGGVGIVENRSDYITAEKLRPVQSLYLIEPSLHPGDPRAVSTDEARGRQAQRDSGASLLFDRFKQSPNA